MSLQELWQLFPIFLTENQACWQEWYSDEESLLKPVFPQGATISHIGSTAVSSIWAKPIIDILVEVPPDRALREYQPLLVSQGYRCMSQSETRMSFNKGYTRNGFAQRVFHLHLRCTGDHNELYFRDYLIDHPEAAKEYEALKLRLWKQFEHNRDAYTNAKAAFVSACTEKARALYGNRY